MRLVLKNVSLALAEFTMQLSVELRSPVTVLFGRSGSGKTSLLDIVAGLRTPDSAFIQLEDQVLTDTSKGIFIPARNRGLGYVPQDLALFPHMSVRHNLLYGHRADSQNQFTFGHIVDLLEIRPLVSRGVNQLSGGEQQRVALARALLTSPRLLLLDEPLANLDSQLKQKIIPYLRRVRDEFKIQMLYVTHDHSEAIALGDEIVVLEKGQITKSGQPSLLL